MTKEESEFDAQFEQIRQRKKEAHLRQVKVARTQFDNQWPQGPVEMTDGNFNEIVRRYPIVIVDFWAPWCVPCQIVGPVIEELSVEYHGRVVFGKTNVDTDQLIAGKYRIISIPTILFFKNGKMVDQQIGAMPKRMLESIIKKYL